MSDKPRIHRLAALSMLAFLSVFTGCASSTAAMAPGWQTSTVYFGRNIGAVEGVSEKDWRSFLKASVTPKFPKGLTVVDGLGQYEDDKNNLIRERSKILILVHPIDEKSRNKVKGLIDRYKAQFKQESVLWVEASSRVNFR